MINKFLISLLAFLCIIDTADAVDFGTPDINENGITEEEQMNILMFMPLEERIQDIRAMVEINNLPEELAKNSNDQIKLIRVEFDDDSLLINYIFNLNIPEDMGDPQTLSDYSEKIRELITENDCSSLNFSHVDVGNKYTIMDSKKNNEIVSFITSYSRCKKTVKAPLLH
ncbi:MAG: hypothetical protein II944_05775 [Ruminobacter sp.]|jgi:hypothetical protein|nr:hypothetical protein [Ruminobacter sp.]MBR1923870.1 hypothetical protein [Ruminobacter sp.]